MYNAGLPIPGGFVITSYAFKHFIHVTGIDKKIFSILRTLDVEDSEKLQKASAVIQDLIFKTGMPLEVKKQILEAYEMMDVDPAVRGTKIEELVKAGRDGANVAVRSSATAEDLPSISEDEYVFVKVNGKPFFGRMKELIETVDLSRDEVHVPAMDNYKVEWEKVSEIYKHKANGDKLYKVTTSTGREITVSSNHSLIILDEETLNSKVIQTKDLKTGSKLPVVRVMPDCEPVQFINVTDYVKGEDVVELNHKIYIKNKSNNWKIQQGLIPNISLDEDFAYLLGIFVAEGSVYKDNCIIFTNTNSQVIDRVKNSITKLGINTEVKINKYSLRIYCKSLLRLLNNSCGEPENVRGKGRGCRTKQVPSFIYSADKKIISEFLKGCFDGDGTIEKNVISYCSVSKKLINGLSVLLGLLGISYYLKNYYRGFVLSLPYSELEKFRNLIGSEIESKALRLDNLIFDYQKMLNHTCSKNSLRFSKNISHEMRSLIEESLPKEKVISFHCPSCMNFLDKTSYYKHKRRYYCSGCKKAFYQSQVIGREVEKYINYDCLGRFLKDSVPWNKAVNTYPNYSQSNFLQKLSSFGGVQLTKVFDESLLWDEVVKVEEINYDSYVYDFCVPNVENFAAGFGSVITHNSASFAGQQASFLNIKGEKKFLAAVVACWASLYTGRAIYYRVQNKFPHEKVLIAVVVQKMVNSESSGVIFTVSPVSKSANEIMIESSYGLGEAVVSGAITPDEYTVDKKTLDVVDRKIVPKTWMFTRDLKTLETVKVDVDKNKQSESSLKENEVRKLAEFAVKVEKHYGKPQDMEFAIERGKIYIVQSRPITTLIKDGEESVEIRARKEEEKVIEEKGDIEIGEANLLVSGLPASPGVGKGRVVLMRDLADMKRVKKSDVLVTRMTTPDNVPAMEKASAIVTDEGGLTCFSGETRILTNKGLKTFKEVYDTNERFFVPSMNRDSLKVEWKPILGCMKRKAAAIEIDCSQTGKMNGNTLVLTPDHKMLTYSDCELVDRRISDVLTNKEMLLIADYLPALRYSRKMNVDKAYLLGALMTDGYIKFNKRRGSVTFCQKNIPSKELFVNKVLGIMSELSGRNVYSYNKGVSGGMIEGRLIVGGNDNYNHIVFSKSFAQEMTIIKENLSEIFLRCDEEVIYNFLGGVIDGDRSYNYGSSRINIYCGKRELLDIIVICCLRIGIVPQITRNRSIFNIQLVEKVEKLFNYTKRVKGVYKRKSNGVRLFSARQLLGNFMGDVNYKGRIRPYVQSNLLIDSEKLKKNILPMSCDLIRNKLNLIINSDTRMIRTKFTKFVGEIDVYNVTVLDNHNYIVFSNRLTPILVNNCHASIVSRELGIPCVVGTEVATKKLKDGMYVTVDANKGKIYAGSVKIHEEKKEAVLNIKTKIKVKVNVDMPSLAEHAVATGADGVGLLRSELINMENKMHPVYMIHNGKSEEFIAHLTEGLKVVAKAFKGKQVWYRTLDARTDEFRNLKGGDDELEEANPMMGWRSIRRGLDQPELLKAEFEAIKRVRKAGFTNLGVMLPMVTDPEQVKQAKKLFRECTKIEPVKDIEFGVMIETPAAVQMIEEICQEGISFISFGTNDLTQFTLAIDRDSEKMAHWYNELHPAVLREIHRVIQTCKKYKVETSICGQAGSNLEMVKFLQKEGINSISANLDAVNSVRKTVARAEGLLK